MTSDIYIPDLDDADFRRLIDARKLVLIYFWAGQTSDPQLSQKFRDAALRHDEVAFAQSNTDAHHGLMLRVLVEHPPTLQGWVEGNLVVAHEGGFDAAQIDRAIEQMKVHLAANA